MAIPFRQSVRIGAYLMRQRIARREFDSGRRRVRQFRFDSDHHGMRLQPFDFAVRPPHRHRFVGRRQQLDDPGPGIKLAETKGDESVVKHVAVDQAIGAL